MILFLYRDGFTCKINTDRFPKLKWQSAKSTVLPVYTIQEGYYGTTRKVSKQESELSN